MLQVTRLRHEQLPCHGTGKEMTKADAARLLRRLIMLHVLEEVRVLAPTIIPPYPISRRALCCSSSPCLACSRSFKAA